ncbi:autophagy-related protein ATG4 [Acrasis kona]|uniref:Cysteine protease n=1 Tax=Acrasis kona TaxID=1008807 RepID=A0AAW2ZEU4_9EUKA
MSVTTALVTLHSTVANLYHKTMYDGFQTTSDSPFWILGIKYNPGKVNKKNKRKKSLQRPTASFSAPNTPEYSREDHSKHFDVHEDSDYHHIDPNEFNIKQLEALTSDFQSRLWFSYRKDFPPIDNELKQIEPVTVAPFINHSGKEEAGGVKYYTSSIHGRHKSRCENPDETQSSLSSSLESLNKIYQSMISFTSDAGWGCMMRSGQMLLAQAFVQNYLGREFRLPPTEAQLDMYKTIVGWFNDNEESPYSIHRIAQAGILFNKKIGEWFGPSTIATVLQRLVHEHLKSEFLVYVADQGTIYKDEVTLLCTGQKDPLNIDNDEELKDTVIVNKSDCEEVNDTNTNINQQCDPTPNTNDETQTWKPVVILIPIRIGLEHMNPIYSDSIKKTFQIPQSLGIMGGKPKSSLYFIGYQDNDLLYLDPHTVQKPASHKSGGGYKSYHCSQPRKLKIYDLDPSMCLGFLCQTQTDFEELCSFVDSLSQMQNPLISIQKWKQPLSPDLDIDYVVDGEDEDDLVVL